MSSGRKIKFLGRAGVKELIIAAELKTRLGV